MSHLMQYVAFVSTIMLWHITPLQYVWCICVNYHNVLWIYICCVLHLCKFACFSTFYFAVWCIYVSYQTLAYHTINAVWYTCFGYQTLAYHTIAVWYTCFGYQTLAYHTIAVWYTCFWVSDFGISHHCSMVHLLLAIRLWHITPLQYGTLALAIKLWHITPL